MIAGIEKHFAEVCKEQGIDLSEQKKEPEQTPPAVEEPAAEEPAAPELDPIDRLAATSTSLPLSLTLMNIGTRWRTGRLR